VGIELDVAAIPVLPGVERLVAAGAVTGGGTKNVAHLGDALTFAEGVPSWMRHLVVDPQTSGGLATFSKGPVEGGVRIGRAVPGVPRIAVGPQR
jgi:selenide,water dikinase